MAVTYDTGDIIKFVLCCYALYCILFQTVHVFIVNKPKIFKY